MNLLLLCAGRRVSLIQALKRSAQRLHIPLRIFATEIDPLTASLRYADRSFIVSRTFTMEHQKEIENLVKEYSIHAILPGSDLDLEFMLSIEKNPAFRGVKFLYSGEPLKKFLSKSESLAFFHEIGLKTPRQIKNPAAIQKKCILKEDRGYGSVNQFIVMDSTECEVLQKRLKDPFIQEFVEGVEYTIDVFTSEQGELINLCPRKRLKVRAGVSDVGEIDTNETLLDELVPLIKKFNLRGPWNIQCIESGGEFFYLEVNPRFSGGIPLSIAAGHDYTQNLLEWAIDAEISSFLRPENGLVMMKYESELFESQAS